MFQIKDFASIVAAQINHGRAVTDKITDYAPGSVARTLIEAPAVEIEELYLQMFLGLRDAIPVATFQSFGFTKLPAKRAFGFVSVSSNVLLGAPISIPVGTKFTTAAGASYSSTAAVTWAAGTSLVRVPVQADIVGLVGNVAAGVINSAALFPTSSGFTVGNSLIANGADAESDADREARFTDHIKAISGGTVAACLYGAGQAVVLDVDGNISEYVTRVGYTEIPGRFTIYIYSNMGLPSAALLAASQLLIDGKRDDINGTVSAGAGPAGVRTDVLAMAERAVAASIKVGMLEGYTLTPAVTQSLNDIYGSAIRGVKPGTTLYLGTLIELMLAVPGVAQIVPVTSANVVCAGSEALTPGVLTVAAL
jgi:uncharacterized phage protein gp47/JayE